jgi:hypothetical protein
LTAVLLAALLGIVLSAAPALAQQWGRDSAPAWGQLSPPAWGQYQGRIGANGWQYDKTLQQNAPAGAILSPNQTSGGPATGALFAPPDTRLLGRTAP